MACGQLTMGGFVIDRDDKDRPAKVRPGGASASLMVNIVAVSRVCWRRVC
jgi:hypothetical protein